VWLAHSFGPDPACERAEVRGRGQGSGGARPRSGRRALTPVPFGARLELSGPGVRFLLCGVSGVVGAVLIIAGCAGGGSERWGCSVIPSRSPTRADLRVGPHDGVRKASGGSTAGRGQSEARPRHHGDHIGHRGGGLDLHGLAAGRRSIRSHATAPRAGPTRGWRRGLPGGYRARTWWSRSA
jgi:hypothetical protein